MLHRPWLTQLYETPLTVQINYGIFPGAHATNLLISHCLSKNDTESAARAAAYAMLQARIKDA